MTQSSCPLQSMSLVMSSFNYLCPHYQPFINQLLLRPYVINSMLSLSSQSSQLINFVQYCSSTFAYSHYPLSLLINTNPFRSTAAPPACPYLSCQDFQDLEVLLMLHQHDSTHAFLVLQPIRNIQIFFRHNQDSAIVFITCPK